MEISAEMAKRRRGERGKELWTALQSRDGDSGEGDGIRRFYLIILDG